MIVDAHVHLLPGRLAEAVRRFFVDHLGANHAGLHYPLDHDAILSELAADGVGAVWSLPYAHKPGTADSMNDASAVTVAAHAAGPVRVVGGATVHPGDDDPRATVERALDRLGLSVLKLHCSVGAFAVDDDRLTGVFRLCAERRVPIVVHLGHSPSGLTDADELDALSRVCDRDPRTRVVLAHCGHHAAPAAVRLLERHPQLHADLTPVGRSRPEVTVDELRTHSRRILFGSDAPNTPLAVRDGIAHVRSFALAPEDEQAILGANAMRLVAEVER